MRYCAMKYASKAWRGSNAKREYAQYSYEMLNSALQNWSTYERYFEIYNAIHDGDMTA